MTAVFNFLMIAGAIQGFIFNVATFLSRKKIEKPVVFLNLFVFFLSLNNLQSWLVDKEFVASHFFWKHLTVPWYVLIVPMFYAFLVYYLEIEKKRWPFVLLSGLIFLVEFSARCLVTYLVYDGYWQLEKLRYYNIMEDVVTLSYSLFLFFKATRILYKYNELYKPILAFDDLKWIKRFLFFGGGVFILWVMAIIFNITEMVAQPYSYYPLRIGSSILIYWTGYQAFFRYVILKDRIFLRREIRKDTYEIKNAVEVRVQNPTATEKKEAVFNQVTMYINSNQKYLDPYLSLENLSEELNMSTSSLSKLINTYSSSNFSDYINEQRVKEAQKLLADSDFSSYTIVAIGLECGFNSKSTFYSAFKKFTDITPTEYRKEAGS